MFVHGTRPCVDTGADDTSEDDITGHGRAATATDFGLHDDRTALITWLGNKYREGVASSDFEAGWRPSDLTRGKPDLSILRGRIDDEHFLRSAGNGRTTDHQKGDGCN